jgi:hypothetical protein
VFSFFKLPEVFGILRYPNICWQSFRNLRDDMIRQSNNLLNHIVDEKCILIHFVICLDAPTVCSAE